LRFRDALGEKVAWVGSELMLPLAVDAAEYALADAVARTVDAGAKVMVMAGSKLMDPLDPAFGALRRLGVTSERHGVPAHPGSLFWIARLRGVPRIGTPNCGLFSKATVFDLELPRILAGERVGSTELAELGHGGFLTRDVAFRFPPYRPTRERGEVPPDDE
jgi:molybdopterin biosynthesis enzyme